MSENTDTLSNEFDVDTGNPALNRVVRRVKELLSAAAKSDTGDILRTKDLSDVENYALTLAQAVLVYKGEQAMFHPDKKTTEVMKDIFHDACAHVYEDRQLDIAVDRLLHHQLEVARILGDEKAGLSAGERRLLVEGLAESYEFYLRGDKHTEMRQTVELHAG